MNWKGFGRSDRDPILRFCSGISLEGLRKTKKKPQLGWPVYGPRYETGTSRIRAGVLTTEVLLSVVFRFVTLCGRPTVCDDQR
jgi:hypothetical protein